MGVTRRLDLCLNCLESGAVQVEVGPDKGSQRDPYRDKLPLCETCRGALLSGDFALLAERYSPTRVIDRSTTKGEQQ